MRGRADKSARAFEIKSELRRLRRESDGGRAARRRIKELYAELDEVQFERDYVCLVIDAKTPAGRKKDFLTACEGFRINGVTYHRLLGTNGGVKTATIVFISDDIAPALRERLECGRNIRELVPAKLEAYRALSCSGSSPVTEPHGVIVVPDCVTTFRDDVIRLRWGDGDEPEEKFEKDALCELDESDGYGLILPSLAETWSKDLRLGYKCGGFVTRNAWEKGTVFAFDFREFAERVAGGYIVTDVWGDERDVREAELIITESMLKLWQSYDNWEHYKSCCDRFGWTWRVTKTAPRRLENERCTNYQFLNPFKLSDDDIEELTRATVTEIADVLSGDVRKTLVFLKGGGLDAGNITNVRSGFAKAIMADKGVMRDSFVRGKIYEMIRARIDRAKVGVLKVHGNYSTISGDPYSLCQSMFGLQVTGLLKAGELYNNYWDDAGADEVMCFRAPMSNNNNIRRLRVARGDEVRYWYRFMRSCTAINSFDNTAAALNGADKDGDLMFITDNDVLLRNYIKEPVLMCEQRRAEKKTVTEKDLVTSNINGFGDDIGKVTNRVTSMFEIQAGYEQGSEEYEELAYRIRCGQLLQQDAIDKVKGILCKPMPKHWFDVKAIGKIDGEDADKRLLYRTVADRKPYFMIYIYPSLKRDYVTYVKNADLKCRREFGMGVEELRHMAERSESEDAFLRSYDEHMPVGHGGCVTNRICRAIEGRFDNAMSPIPEDEEYDYANYKYGVEYSARHYKEVARLYEEYLRQVQLFKHGESSAYSNDGEDDSRQLLLDTFRRRCGEVGATHEELTDIIIDVCYRRKASKQFAWDLCGDDITANLLRRSGGILTYPTKDETAAEFTYGGEGFRMAIAEISED